MSESGQPTRIETRMYDADGNVTKDESAAVRGEVVELDVAGRVIARHRNSTGKSTRNRSRATKASWRPVRPTSGAEELGFSRRRPRDAGYSDRGTTHVRRERDVDAALEKMILAGGCFWGMQDLFRRRPGVVSTRVGYSGGDVPNATYRNHGTHAEAIEIVFDPEQTSYRDLLEFFFQIHDPTTLNRQGNDIGASYRSAIFYLDEEQRRVAEETIADVEASERWPGKVVTEVAPAGPFWEAEPEHQDYLEHYPAGYTCHFVRPDWVLSEQAKAASG